MKAEAQKRISWQNIPLLGLFVAEWQAWQQERMQPHYSLALIPQDASDLTPYPINMSYLLDLPLGTLDEGGVPYNRPLGKHTPATYHPTTIAEYALALWNTYLDTGNEKHRDAFMIQVHWLIEHEVPLANGAGGWPIPFAVPLYNTSSSWLSALTQGNVISVLIRAYQLTSEDIFLQAARRAVRTFELEVKDGGVAAPVGENGVFFEEVATGFASHILNGYILALFGLYDYVSSTGDIYIDELIKRSLTTLHTLIDEFDAGYWSFYDLHFRSPASLFYHALHVTLLEALAHLSGCQHCAMLAAKWDRYQHSRSSRLRYFIISRALRCRRGVQRGIFYTRSKYMAVHK